MTPPTRDDLALYVMGDLDGDHEAIEAWLATDPAASAALAAEVDLEVLLREAARHGTFCAICHDLLADERCACERSRARRLRAPMVVAAVTFAAAAALAILLLRSSSTPASGVTRQEQPAIAPVVPAPTPTPTPTPTPPPAPMPTSTPTAPAPPKTVASPKQPAVVELRIVTQPAGVEVFIDQRAQGLSPLVVTVPRSNTPVQLSLQHLAYQPLVRRVTPLGNMDVSLTMTSLGLPPVHDGAYSDEQCMKCHKTPRLLRRPVNQVNQVNQVNPVNPTEQR